VHLAGDVGATRGLLDHIEAQFAHHVELLEYAASIYASIRDFDSAVRVCRRLLVLVPDAADTLSRLGSTLHRLGQIEDAKDACLRALAIDPQNLKALERLAIIDMASKELGPAENRIRLCLSIAPDTARAHYLLAQILRQTNRYEESLPHARRAAELEPGNERYGRLAKDEAQPIASKADATSDRQRERTGG
jgi:tetratricopeptide (TPR) repeat protein